MSPPQLVWFKRDLRVEDHRPLSLAARAGPVVCLYVVEPELVAAPEFSADHWRFIAQSLGALDRSLRTLGGCLVVRTGELPGVFDRLHNTLRFDTLWSHQETGNALTYARDRRVADWCRGRGVTWRELPNHGVFRPLRSRDGWAARWEARMREPIARPPREAQFAACAAGRIPSPEELGLGPPRQSEAVGGGADHAAAVLEDFLETRGADYRTGLSSPVTAWSQCSRLSPHLAWGNLSVRQVHQATRARMAELHEAAPAERTRWLGSLRAFSERLRWHCHFMQKLEDEPRIEFENMNRGYDGLREEDFDEALFDAWCRGATGYPLVDACMRALQTGGWINFRMRAMLVSFATHHLWLHWRRPALHLGRLFLDFEPGIHYPQVQMQAGTTGINAVRIYSPIKQVRDQDPSGIFIRRYCPELAGVPDAYLPEPHRMPPGLQRAVGCVIGRDYPAPIVEHGPAYQAARRRLYAVKGSAEARREARRVYARHGSRRGTGSRGGRR